VTIPLSDSDKLDWLESRPGRLEDVKWHMDNYGSDLRKAIEELAAIQESAGQRSERVTQKIKVVKDE
jgi:hypothetical protein